MVGGHALDRERPSAENGKAKPYTGGEALADGQGDIATELPRVLDRGDPLACGRRFLADEFTRDGKVILYRHRGDFYEWVRSRWECVEESDLRAQLYEYLEVAETIGKNNNLVSYKPTARRVTDILDGLKAAVRLSSGLAPPTWLSPGPELPPSELLACCNGLLHLPEMELLGHDVDFFNLSALDVAYDPKAADPTQWLAFLRSLWKEDSEAIATLLDALLLDYETNEQSISWAKYLDGHLRPFFGHMLASRVETRRLQRYLLNRRKDGIVNKTVKNELGFLRRAFNLAR